MTGNGPWCNNGKHARSLFSDSKLMESILEVDVGKNRIVKSNIREWTMVGDDNCHKYAHMGELPLRQQ